MAEPFRGMNTLNTGWAARSAWFALEHAPSWCDPLLDAGRRWVLPFSRPFLPVELRRGRTLLGEHADILMIGRGMQLEYLSRRFFAAEPERAPGPSVGLHELRKTLMQGLDQADMVLALVPRVLSSRLAGRAFLRVPAFLDFLLPAAAVADFKDVGRSVRQRILALHKSALLRPRVSHSLFDFERFYSDYYLPLVLERFGDLAICQPARVLRRRFRFGGIVWVERDGTSLGGEMYERRGTVLKCLVRGRLSTLDRRADATTVSLATYLFTREHARALGCAWVNTGGTLPVLDDGLFCHKRAWGALATPREETHFELLIGWRRPGMRVSGLLAAAPLVYRDGDGLAALAALTDAAPADPHRAAGLFRAWLPRGIDRLTVLAPEGWSKPARGTPLPLAEHLSLRSGLDPETLQAQPAALP